MPITGRCRPDSHSFTTGLHDFASTLPKNTEMVEVGCWIGESAKIFLDSGNIARIILVDPYDPILGKDVLEHAAHVGATMEEAIEAMTNNILNKYPQSSHIRLPSVEAAILLADRKFDLVYIDAFHEEWSVRQDIEAWRPLVKSGGILAGHDYFGFPGVKAAVDSLLGGPDKTFPDQSWIKKL